MIKRLCNQTSLFKGVAAFRAFSSGVPNPEMFEIGKETRGDHVTEEEMYRYKEKHFMDRTRLHVYGGKGGIGCATHEQTRKGLKGRPSGGSGGNGGAVYIRAVEQEPDLSYLRSKVRADLQAHQRKPRQAWHRR
jgi:hypothetical protein